ncbi:MAG: Trm112 family protein [Rickettsiales bacterium]|nr:Trm112 family protein [Rickettsiales bacterium]
MEISKELLKILVCPVTKQKLIYDKENLELVSPNVALGFPIVNGIPIMLADESRPVSQERIKKLLAQKAEKKAAEKRELDKQDPELFETKIA